MNLAVIACHFNPAGFCQSRRNFLRFMRQMEAEGVPLFVAELVYDDEPWLLPEAANVLRVRTERLHTMWHKENLLNMVERIVPSTYDALAWIDVDVWFQELAWYDETCAALEEHPVTQMFEKAVWTTEDGRPGFVAASAASQGKLSMAGTPGFAWAARRTLWEQAGGLHDRAVIGGGDAVNASAWLPCDESEYRWLRYPEMSQRVDSVRSWFRKEGGTCGSVKGTIWHEWHGEMANRHYIDRHQLASLIDSESHLRSREDGLLQFTPSVSREIPAKIDSYFRSRKEDRTSAY